MTAVTVGRAVAATTLSAGRGGQSDSIDSAAKDEQQITTTTAAAASPAAAATGTLPATMPLGD